MTDVLDLAEQMWRGEADYHPFRGAGSRGEVASGIAFVHGFSNVSALATDDGLVLVDTGTIHLADVMHDAVRDWSTRAAAHRGLHPRAHRPRASASTASRTRTRERGAPAPAVVAHEAVPAALRSLRADRRVQRRHQPAAVPFARARLAGRVPLPRRRPTATASTSTSAARASSCTTTAARPTTTPGCGSPSARCCAPATCSSGPSPNCGNPQKVQRYPRGVGRRAAQDGRRSAPSSCCPATACRSSGGDRIHAGAAPSAAELLESLHRRRRSP